VAAATQVVDGDWFTGQLILWLCRAYDVLVVKRRLAPSAS
jgi:hypothetical protein